MGVPPLHPVLTKLLSAINLRQLASTSKTNKGALPQRPALFCLDAVQNTYN